MPSNSAPKRQKKSSATNALFNELQHSSSLGDFFQPFTSDVRLSDCQQQITNTEVFQQTQLSDINTCSAPKRFREPTLQRSLLDEISNTPKLTSSSSRLQQIIDDRLQRMNDELFERIKSLLRETENRIVNDFEKRICDLRSDFDDVTERMSKLEKVSDDVGALKLEIKELKFQALKHENSLVACELRLNGIPYSKDENLFSVFDIICKNINIPTPHLKSIHRLQNRNNTKKHNSPDAVIIVKLMSPYDKNFFLKCLSSYKKDNNNQLILNTIGFDSNNPFYINENLSNSNYKIFQEAIRLKKMKFIQSAYTFRGLVYVRRDVRDDPICIEHIDVLNGFRNNDLQHTSHTL